MLNLVFYFQVHRPYRLKNLNIFDIGSVDDPFDENLNRSIVEEIAFKCYVPANRLLLRLIERYEGRFKVAFSLTGTAIEQLKNHAPQAMELFARLARTGCVEFIGETYYHSLAYLFDREEFLEQVGLHLALMKGEFGTTPVVFRNTELIYENGVSEVISPLPNYQVVLVEGADRILGWRSPLYPYRSEGGRHYLMCRYYSLSDDIAFRFSERGWVEHPLTVDKFVGWVDSLALAEDTDKNLYLNLFMDYETLGEHQWEETGIFRFLESMPEKLFARQGFDFAWPSDVIEGCEYTAERLSVPCPVSWADTERDLSAWLSNEMQRNAANTLYELLRRAKTKGDERALGLLRRLSGSDHLFYMCTKYFQDGEVHRYFSPYESPESAYLCFLYALAGIEEKLS